MNTEPASPAPRPVLKRVSPGDEVYWRDPDEGISSGYYTVVWVGAPEGVERMAADTVVGLRNEAGSELEALLGEIE